MGERDFERKGAKELFGDFAGGYSEARGIPEYLKVAGSIVHVENRVRSRDLRMLDMPKFGNDPDTMYVVYEEGQTLGESLGIWCIEGQVWIAECDLERFTQLVGLEGRKKERKINNYPNTIISPS